MKNSFLTDEGICYACLSGQYLNSQTLKCESCHSTCSSCSGPMATDCIACEAPNFLDNSRCIPCCSENFNDIEGLPQDFSECCHCLSLKGPCSSSIAVDRTRSVSLDSDMLIDNKKSDNFVNLLQSPFFIIIIIIVSSILLFGIVFTALQIRASNSSDSRPKNLKEYRKVSAKYTSVNFDKSAEQLSLTADDDEEEDSLFEKT